MRRRERQDESPQHLRFAGAGRADADAVRSHSLLSAFLQVQVHGATVVVDAERDTQEIGRGAGAPQPCQVDGLVQIDAEHVLDVCLLALDHFLMEGREGATCREVAGNGFQLPGLRTLRNEMSGVRIGAACPVGDGRLVTQVDADVDVVGFVEAVVQEMDDGHLQVAEVQGLVGMAQA